jgi:hypothetical protein
MSSFLPISMRHAIREQNRKIQHSNKNGEGFLDHASNFVKDESQTKTEQERRNTLQNNTSQRRQSANVNISSQARTQQTSAATTAKGNNDSVIEELNFPPGSIYDEDGKITPPQTTEERSSFNKDI